jgi:DNA/RNA endonuclease G (NUC1)
VPERPFRWSPDPTLSRQFQPVDEHFRGTGFDRGHLAAATSLEMVYEMATSRPIPI